MPRAQRCGAESGVTSWPSNSIVPEEGGNAPAIKLNSVDFPAPFGPIRPTISPRRCWRRRRLNQVCRAQLHTCVAQMSREHREIIDLVYYHEKSVVEVAKIIQMARNTV